MIAAGTQETRILNHMVMISMRSQGILPGFFSLAPAVKAKGQSLFQKSTTTARMAPSWITTSNMPKKSSLIPAKGISSSSRIKCPVLLTGSHSVIPSTIP